jgi:nitric oxide reductase subunit C
VKALTNADRLSDEVVAGKRIFQKYNCNDCHTILGFGAYYAPDLTKVYDRRGENYIRGVIASPEIVLANSFRKMQKQDISSQEIDELVAFFRWVNDIDTHQWPPQDYKTRRSSAVNRLVEGATLSPGAALFKENGCFECHLLGGVGGTEGPALDQVGARLNVDQIAKIIADPQSTNPNSLMPAYDEISPEDRLAIAEFLSRQGGEQ